MVKWAFYSCPYFTETYSIQWWKWFTDQNPENMLKILNLPLYTPKKCIYEQVWSKPATLKCHFSILESGIQDQSGKLSSLSICICLHFYINHAQHRVHCMANSQLSLGLITWNTHPGFAYGPSLRHRSLAVFHSCVILKACNKIQM